MRLEFNIVVVDDDLADPDEKEAVEELISFVRETVEAKGFKPIVQNFVNVENYKQEIPADTSNRIDLFLSDNNLGAGEHGIEFYFDLTATTIHDFVLYTRDSHQTIVEALIQKLNKSGDPNLFSRFTFVHRDTDPSWMEPIEDVIDHILSKREEINNLRGLYAQEMSKVENHLRTKLRASSSDSLQTLIDTAYSSKKIDIGFKRKLHYQRYRRNGIIHNDEEFCETQKKWFVTYEEKIRGRYKTTKVYENEFLRIRTELSEVVDLAMQI